PSRHLSRREAPRRAGEHPEGPPLPRRHPPGREPAEERLLELRKIAGAVPDRPPHEQALAAHVPHPEAVASPAGGRGIGALAEERTRQQLPEDPLAHEG